MPSNITVEANSNFSMPINFNASSLANITVQLVGNLTGGSLPTVVNSSGIFTLQWELTSDAPPAFELLLFGTSGSPAIWSPTIYFCACQNNGTCQFLNTSTGSSNQTSVYTGSCLCPGNYSGDFCQYDPCNGLVSPCFPNVTCNVTGYDFQCGACPQNYAGDGVSCSYNDPCNNTSCAYECMSQESANYSYTCICQTGYMIDPSDYNNCTGTLMFSDSHVTKIADYYQETVLSDKLIKVDKISLVLLRKLTVKNFPYSYEKFPYLLTLLSSKIFPSRVNFKNCSVN